MIHQSSMFAVCVALATLACVRSTPSTTDSTEKEASADAATIALTPRSDASEASAPPAPSAVTYDDKNDLPENAGDTRCKEHPAANAKPASVTLEMHAKPPAIDISIPSLGVKQRLWAGSTSASECSASVVAGGKALRFRCADEVSAVEGKVYARRSDVVLGRASMQGTGQTRFVLPCGTPAKLEPVACPKECAKDGDHCRCGTTPNK